MSHRALAARSGVSVPTVKRVLGGKSPEVSMATFLAIAAALGLSARLEAEDAVAMRRRTARAKAEWIAGMVQGTSGLEAQAVDARTREEIVERVYHELMAGSSRRLWDE